MKMYYSTQSPSDYGNLFIQSIYTYYVIQMIFCRLFCQDITEILLKGTSTITPHPLCIGKQQSHKKTSPRYLKQSWIGIAFVSNISYQSGIVVPCSSTLIEIISLRYERFSYILASTRYSGIVRVIFLSIVCASVSRSTKNPFLVIF